MIAPRPFLIMGGNSAAGDGIWAFVKEVGPVYELLGARIASVSPREVPAGHTQLHLLRSKAFVCCSGSCCRATLAASLMATSPQSTASLSSGEPCTWTAW